MIGLPPNLFFGTGIPACILIFKRNRPDDRVMFVDASREFEQDKAQNKLRPADVDKILGTYRARQNIDRYAYLADREEIEDNEFNLSIRRYLTAYDSEPDINFPEVQAEIEELDTQLSEVRVALVAHLKQLGLLETGQ